MTDQPKWTLGPWRVLNDDAIKVAAKDGSLATVTHIHLRGRRDTNEVEANAHLIAAAPDLYAALEEVLRTIGASDHWWMNTPSRGGFDADAIAAALAKARGEA